MDERHSAPHYQIFLLRVWQEDDAAWRAVLQETETGEKNGFTDLEALLQHMLNTLRQPSAPTTYLQEEISDEA